MNGQLDAAVGGQDVSDLRRLITVGGNGVRVSNPRLAGRACTST
ncbi:MAG TPA: hypothetical protein VHR39_12605 [Propionibacteriaceae bacterium]|jgi:hypothetical protein|nr:hypothetical protein [Propionibacteriaceae bacterium]